MITGASPRSSLAALPAAVSVTFTRVALGSPEGASVSTVPALAFSLGRNAPGRTLTTAGVAVSVSV